MKQTARKRRLATRNRSSKKVRKSGKSCHRPTHYPHSRGRLYFSTGQAAHELRTTQADIRSLCHSGLIEAKHTRRGHFRISPQEVQRLKAEGLPQVPSGEARPPEPARIPPGLYAPPSDGLAQAADTAKSLENQVRTAELELRGELLTDKLANYRAKKSAIELEAARQRKEHQRQRIRENWTEHWIEYAVGRIPATVPREYLHDASVAIIALFSTHDPSGEEHVIQSLVDGVIRKTLAPYYKQLAIDGIIERAPGLLSRSMYFAYGEMGRWKQAVLAEAEQRVRALPDGYSTREAENAVAQAAEHVQRQRQEEMDREEIIQSVRWKIPAGEMLQRATEAVAGAIQKLPAGSRKETIERARDQALTPFLREKQAGEQAAAYVQHVSEYVNQLYEPARDPMELLTDVFAKTDLIHKIQQEIRPLLAAKILNGEITGGDASLAFIEEYIDDRDP